jgi:hypothetical protein
MSTTPMIDGLEARMLLAQTPFGGAPFTVNQTIQAERYDRGSEGVAYHDYDANNDGGQFRPADGVDIQAATDPAGGAYEVFSVYRGDWLEYTVSVPRTARYDIQTRVGGGGQTQFHYEVDGVRKAIVDFQEIPERDYQTLTHSLGTLTAGNHVLRLYVNSGYSSYVPTAINWLRIVPGSGVASSDSRAPAAPYLDPRTISASRASHTIDLAWPAVADSSGIARYLIYRRGALTDQLVGTNPGNDTTFTDNLGEFHSDDYEYFVYAVDNAGNISDAGPAHVHFGVGALGRGLTGTYFNNDNFTDPVFSRLDPEINFDWGRGSPDPRIDPDTFSVRWTGFIKPISFFTPDRTAPFTFFAPADNRSKLVINGQTVIDYIPGKTPKQGTITLTEGQVYSITLEHREFTGRASAKLRYSGPGDSDFVSTVHTWRLFPAPPAAATPGPTNPPPTKPGKQRPFKGTPFAVNQIIQAEDFDKGGQGVAYNDSEPKNKGFQYRRDEGVDIELSHDAGGGHAIAYAKPGEWLEYTIRIPKAGSHKILTRLAAARRGRLHFEINRVRKASIAITPSGDNFRAYRTIRRRIGQLTAGVHVLRLKFDSTDGPRGVANVNWLKIVPTRK